MDVAICLALSPVIGVSMVLIAIVSVVQLGRPVLFKQIRPGRGGTPFLMVKFRTMSNEVDADGQLLPDSHRLTPFGRFLRQTSLDELPEFWNVLKGDMSLVGPRPLLMEYLDRYTEEQFRRHDVLPGITGWAQVNGRNALDWSDKFALDLWYVDNQTFLLDIKILILTILHVVQRKGINAPDSATMPAFNGEKELPSNDAINLENDPGASVD